MRVALIFVFLCIVNNLGISQGFCSNNIGDHDSGSWLKCSNTNIQEALSAGNLAFSGIVISHSNISTIGPYAFTKYAGTLKELNLLTCGISSVSPNAFKTLSQLRKLSLAYNNITVVHPEWFDDLIWLEDLDLSFNNIGTIPSKAFEGMANVRSLSIRHNKMTCFRTADTFAKMKSLKEIHIEGNPWEMNYRGKMTRWFHDKKINYHVNTKTMEHILDEILWICSNRESNVCGSENHVRDCFAILLLNQLRSAERTSNSYALVESKCIRERNEFTTCVSRSTDNKVTTNGKAVKMLLSGLWAMKSS
ncbi:P-granule-associated novel protein 1 [Cephus cinctus]|uniref:p-granule-associated novel protein 1 n=1 Tax=Cephus cinctus TaxID=211228 RepID=A0AAJ7CC62_CEPCN|nr:P-granule-associated novel protein 1 [Cephus cinctus]